MAPTYFLTGENKMNYTETQMKSELWDIVYKAKNELGIGREVTNAIIDVMILMDKQQQEEEEAKC